jgi:hypothetical protein
MRTWSKTRHGPVPWRSSPSSAALVLAALAVALASAACVDPGSGGGNDAATADASVQQDGAEDAASGCNAGVVLAPLTFRGFRSHDPASCGVDYPNVLIIHVWAFRDGALVSQFEAECTEAGVSFEALSPGTYDFAAIGYVDGRLVGAEKAWPYYIVGARLLQGVYLGDLGSCAYSAPQCDPLTVELTTCGHEESSPLELYCWEGVNLITDGCGL